MSSGAFLSRLDDAGMVTTDNGLRSWMLQHLLGYRVVRVTMEPANGWFGGIQYRTHWSLAR